MPRHKGNKREWVRTFEVGPPQRHPQGHTVYLVSSTLFPAGFPEAGTKLVATKRFSDFQRLHKALFLIHANLYLSGKFPLLPNTNYFKRFDPPVLEIRRQSCLALLQFAADHPQLYNSQVFLNFFSSATTSPTSPGLSDNEEDEEEEHRDQIAELANKGHILEAAVLAKTSDPTPALKPVPVEKDSKDDHKDDDLPTYLSEAASEISKAIQYECEEKYPESVACYRNAIGTLLSSVQRDKCLQRQASVKRRIAQYIGKAESLMKMDKPAVVVRKSANIPHLELFGDIRDLRRYKINCVLAHKVLLVNDAQSNTAEHFESLVVIKTIQKSAMVFKSNRTSMLPINIPFMVKLLRYYETDDALHLILEFASGGKLYNIVQPYLNNQAASLMEEEEQDDQLDYLAAAAPGGAAQTVSPFSTSRVSVIKASPSFVQVRKASLQPSPVDQEEEEDMDFVCTLKTESNEDLLCVSNEGIERFSHEEEEEEPFDFVNDCVDEEADEADEGMRIELPRLVVREDYLNPEKLVDDSKSLLASVSSKLQRDDSKDSAEQILSHLNHIENKIQSHLSGRCLTPVKLTVTPAISTPISAGSTTISPSSISRTPSRANSPADTPLCSIIPTFGGVDLKTSQVLPMSLLRYWSAQLCEVVFALHSRGIVIQDLNPANLLLDRDGQLKLTYQCEWVSIDRPLDVRAIEQLYSAPEVSDIQPLTSACDWWSVGVILFELLTGCSFHDSYPSGLLLHAPLLWPPSKTSELREGEAEMQDLIDQLLKPYPDQRLDEVGIRAHKFFRGVDWTKP